MKSILNKYKHAWVLAYVFIYLAWFFYLEQTVTDDYHIMHASLDDLIPFNEYFIIPYTLWFLYVTAAVVYFLFTGKADYYRLCAFLFTGMTICMIICTFFRNGTDFRPLVDPGKNLCSRIVYRLYQTDTCTNVFPSIHVYNSIGVHIAIMKSERLRPYRIVRFGSLILAVAICLSTLFLKQHSVIDVAGAAVLAYVMYYMVGYGWMSEDKKVAQKVMG